MTETTNFGLKKPEENDFYDFETQNENLDEIDRILQGCKESAENISALTTNIISPTITTTTKGGITLTDNRDGTYTLSGTATSDQTFNLALFNCAESGKYKLVGCPENGSADTYQLCIAAKSVYDFGEGVISDFVEGEKYTISIKVTTNTTISDLVFKPMITTNQSATYNDFVPYTGNTGKLNGDLAEIAEGSAKSRTVYFHQKGWHRIAEYVVTAGSSFLYRIKGADAQSCILNIKRSYNNSLNEAHALHLSCVYESQEFSSVNGLSSIQLIKKIRYAYSESDSKAYIDVYYDSDKTEIAVVSIESPKGIGGHWNILKTPSLVEETVDGVTVTTTYDIPAKALPLTTGNKPTGTYTGNGSSTSRTIATGGIGDVCIINSTQGVAIVTEYGAIVKTASGTSVTGLASNNVKFIDGVLTIASNGSYVNSSSVGYTYQVV